MHHTNSSYSIADVVLQQVAKQLQAPSQLLTAFAQGICYGIASSALVYQALGRFQHFHRLLQALRESPVPLAAADTLARRELLETVCYLQSIELQASVLHTKVSAQRLSAQALLTDIKLASFFVSMDYHVLMAFLTDYRADITGVMLRLQPSHVAALISHQGRWYLIDSLASSVPDFTSFEAACLQAGVIPGQRIDLMVLLPPAGPRYLAVQAVLHHPLYQAPPWQNLCYGKKTAHCPKCNETKLAVFHSSNIPGVEGRICNTCYQQQRESIVQTCSQCNESKAGYFYRSNIPGVEGRICSACNQRQHRIKRPHTPEAEGERALPSSPPPLLPVSPGVVPGFGAAAFHPYPFSASGVPIPGPIFAYPLPLLIPIPTSGDGAQPAGVFSFNPALLPHAAMVPRCLDACPCECHQGAALACGCLSPG